MLYAVIVFGAGVSFGAPKSSVPKDGNFVIGPVYTDAPAVLARAGVPKGVVHEFVMESRDSKIYPGLNGPYQRKVWVYVPAQYKKGTAAPLLVVQDGQHYLKRVTNILDNLIAERRLSAMVAVFINAGGGDGKGSERGLEYDTLSDGTRITSKRRCCRGLLATTVLSLQRTRMDARRWVGVRAALAR